MAVLLFLSMNEISQLIIENLDMNNSSQNINTIILSKDTTYLYHLHSLFFSFYAIRTIADLLCYDLSRKEKIVSTVRWLIMLELTTSPSFP